MVLLEWAVCSAKRRLFIILSGSSQAPEEMTWHDPSLQYPKYASHQGSSKHYLGIMQEVVVQHAG